MLGFSRVVVMILSYLQVKENREKRQMELDKRRREQQNKKEAMHKAKQMVLLEERSKEMKTRREEMEIRKEMNKIRKEMQEERKKVEDMKTRYSVVIDQPFIKGLLVSIFISYCLVFFQCIMFTYVSNTPNLPYSCIKNLVWCNLWPKKQQH